MNSFFDVFIFIYFLVFINKWAPGRTLGRISFICHSLGGIVCRAALPYLSDFNEKMFTFLSLAVPHLGYG